MCDVARVVAVINASPSGPAFLDARDLVARPGLLRTALLLLVALLALVQQRSTTALVAVLALAAFGVLASWRPPPRRLGWLAVSAEVITCCVAVAPTGGSRSPLLPYLLAPALVTGLAAGARAAILVSGLAAATLVTLRVADVSATDSIQDYTAATAQWISLGLAAGLVAAWVRQVLDAAALGNDPRYTAAYRLLLELRQVARSLPGTLDTVSTTSGVLDDLDARVGFQRAVVLLHGDGEHLIPVAVRGVERSTWSTALDGAGPVARAWSSGEPATEGDSVALPWQAGERMTGVVVLSRGEGGFAAQEVVTAQGVLGASAVRLDTALLFDEIRGLATVEERRRLGREIHDGIAQDLVYLGYELDAALSALPEDPDRAAETLARLREENSRMLSELRLSVYDLRNTVDGDRGLAAALSDHVRRLGNSTDLIVHLTLAQSGQRLGVATESEVLRIAQEALSNARRHAEARNLWVELIIEPPMVSLRVEDDGRGIDAGADPGFGLSIMRERSDRIGAEFTVRPRSPHGTSVVMLLRGR